MDQHSRLPQSFRDQKGGRTGSGYPQDQFPPQGQGFAANHPQGGGPILDRYLTEKLDFLPHPMPDQIMSGQGSQAQFGTDGNGNFGNEHYGNQRFAQPTQDKVPDLDAFGPDPSPNDNAQPQPAAHGRDGQAQAGAARDGAAAVFGPDEIPAQEDAHRNTIKHVHHIRQVVVQVHGPITDSVVACAGFSVDDIIRLENAKRGRN